MKRKTKEFEIKEVRVVTEDEAKELTKRGIESLFKRFGPEGFLYLLHRLGGGRADDS